MTMPGRAQAERKMAGRSVVSRGDAPPVFKIVEHVFNAAAFFVERGVVLDCDLALLAGRDAGVAAVGEQRSRVGHGVEQGACADIIGGLAGGQKQADRTAICIGENMRLGVHAAFRSPDETRAPPFDRVGWRPRGAS